MLRRTLLIAVIIILSISFIGCDETSDLTGNISYSFNGQNNEEAKEVLVFNDNISEFEKQLFFAGAEMIASFYNVECNSEKFLKTDINDMGDYSIVSIPSDFVYFQVRIDNETMDVFCIDSSLYSFTQFMINEVEDYTPANFSEYGMYKYEKDPINETYAKRVVEDFIKNTPLANTKMRAEEVKFEYKFDSTEKEFTVIKYFYINAEMKYERIYIKVDNYMRKVVQLLK